MNIDSSLHPSQQASSNYFLRHWRGELSLGISYWVNGGLIVSLFATALIAVLILGMESAGFSLRAIALGSLSLLILAVAIWVWSVVGIWRSAKHHVSRGGSRAWAIAARLMVVLGLLAMIGNFFESVLPQAREYGLIIVGKDPLGKIAVKVAANGQAVIVEGALGEGAASEVETILNATPGAKLLVLNSNGGRILEAERLAMHVKNRSLDTYVEGICASACTYVFLAGKDRASTPNARIGFHQPSFAGINREGQQMATERMMNTYRNANLPDTFIQKVSQTPPEGMWYPTRDELIAANVITRISLGGEAAVIGTSLTSKQEMHLALRSSAYWRAIEKRFPDKLDEAVDKAWEAKSQGGSDAEILNASRAVVADIVPELLKTADDATLDRFVKLTIDQLVAARTISGEACAKLLASELDVTRTLPKSLVEQEQQFIEYALEAPARSDRRPLDSAQYAKAIQRASSALSEDGMKVIANMGAYASQPDVVCDAMIAFLRWAAALPQHERHVTLRVIFQSED